LKQLPDNGLVVIRFIVPVPLVAAADLGELTLWPDTMGITAIGLKTCWFPRFKTNKNGGFEFYLSFH